MDGVDLIVVLDWFMSLTLVCLFSVLSLIFNENWEGQTKFFTNFEFRVTLNFVIGQL